jgi:hypothetical protein
MFPLRLSSSRWRCMCGTAPCIHQCPHRQIHRLGSRNCTGTAEYHLVQHMLRLHRNARIQAVAQCIPARGTSLPGNRPQLRMLCPRSRVGSRHRSPHRSRSHSVRCRHSLERHMPPQDYMTSRPDIVRLRCSGWHLSLLRLAVAGRPRPAPVVESRDRCRPHRTSELAGTSALRYTGSRQGSAAQSSQSSLPRANRQPKSDP